MVYDLSRIEQLKRRKEFEENRDIDWEEIAEATNVSISTLWRYRTNKASPQKNNLLAVCNYFGVSIDYFVEGSSQGEDNLPGNQSGHPIVLGGPITVSVAHPG